MTRPNLVRRSFTPTLTVLIFLLIGGANGQTQGLETDQATSHGIELYQRGNAAEAIKVLQVVVKKHPEDADAWYYLARAFNSEGAIGAARPAFEHVITLRPDFADAYAKLSYALILANETERAIAAGKRAIELGDHSAEPHYAIAESSFRTGAIEKAVEEANLALQIKPDFGLAFITKSLAHYSLKQYEEAAASLERFLAIDSRDADQDVWRAQLESLRGFKQSEAMTNAPRSAESTPDLPLTCKQVTVKARVLSKPEPTYTEAARRAGVTGTVVIRCVFSGNGEIRNLFVTRALGFGLTSKAVQAARRIKFNPAIKDDRPVSMYMQLEYNFYLY